jgi:hypothetical protein
LPIPKDEKLVDSDDADDSDDSEGESQVEGASDEETRELPDHLRDLYQSVVEKIEDPDDGFLIQQLLVEYQDIFLRPGDMLGVAKVHPHRIDTGQAAPVTPELGVRGFSPDDASYHGFTGIDSTEIDRFAFDSVRMWSDEKADQPSERSVKQGKVLFQENNCPVLPGKTVKMAKNATCTQLAELSPR